MVQIYTRFVDFSVKETITTSSSGLDQISIEFEDFPIMNQSKNELQRPDQIYMEFDDLLIKNQLKNKPQQPQIDTKQFFELIIIQRINLSLFFIQYALNHIISHPLPVKQVLLQLGPGPVPQNAKPASKQEKGPAPT